MRRMTTAAAVALLIGLIAVSCTATMQTSSAWSNDIYGPRGGHTTTSTKPSPALAQRLDEMSELDAAYHSVGTEAPTIEDDEVVASEWPDADEPEVQTPYERVLSTSYQDSYERRLRGFRSPYYGTINYNIYLSDDYWYTQAYDPAFYNTVVVGDQIWVEPWYISASFGWPRHRWSLTYGYNPYWYHPFRYGPYGWYGYHYGYYGHYGHSAYWHGYHDALWHHHYPYYYHHDYYHHRKPHTKGSSHSTTVHNNMRRNPMTSPSQVERNGGSSTSTRGTASRQPTTPNSSRTATGSSTSTRSSSTATRPSSGTSRTESTRSSSTRSSSTSGSTATRSSSSSARTNTSGTTSSRPSSGSYNRPNRVYSPSNGSSATRSSSSSTRSSGSSSSTRSSSSSSSTRSGGSSRR